MKKIIFLLLSLTSFSVFAQDPISYSFINPSVASFVVVSNKLGATNLIGGFTTTNVAGFTFSNNIGNLVTTVAGSNDTFNVFQDISLWGDRDGRPMGPPLSYITNAPVDYNGFQFYGGSMASISATFLCDANSTNAVSLTFAPVPDGTNVSTVVADRFVWSVIGTGKGFSAADKVVTSATNFPSWKYPGVLKFRLLSITQTNGAALSNDMVFDAIQFNGFKP